MDLHHHVHQPGRRHQPQRPTQVQLIIDADKYCHLDGHPLRLGTGLRAPLLEAPTITGDDELAFSPDLMIRH